MKKTILSLLLCVGLFTTQALAQSETTTEMVDSNAFALCGTKLYSVDKGALLDVAIGHNDRPAVSPECVEGLDAF